MKLATSIQASKCQMLRNGAEFSYAFHMLADFAGMPLQTLRDFGEGDAWIQYVNSTSKLFCRLFQMSVSFSKKHQRYHKRNVVIRDLVIESSVGTSEQLLMKTSERTAELKKFEADLAECRRARKSPCFDILKLKLFEVRSDRRSKRSQS